MGKAAIGWVLGLALILVACAPQQPQPMEPTRVEKSDALPAPVPQDAAVTIGAQDAGKTISVAVGQKVSIGLVGIPTAGYLWAVTEKPAFLSDPVEGGGPTTQAQTQPGFTGGNHWEVFTFTVQAKGKGKVALEQRRPWEKNEPPSETFSVTIEAK
jgi:inhibitor of cysteine peptidase